MHSREMKDNHTILTDTLEKLACFNANSEGYCEGLSFSFMQALYAGQVDVFLDRFDRMKKLSPIKLNMLQIYLRFSSGWDVLKRCGLSEQEKKELIDIAVFINSVLIYQDARKQIPFPKEEEPREQNYPFSMNVMMPEFLQKQVIRISALSFIFTQKILASFIKEFIKLCTDAKLQQPISFFIFGSDHDSFISFLPAEKKIVFYSGGYGDCIFYDLSESAINSLINDITFEFQLVKDALSFICFSRKGDEEKAELVIEQIKEKLNFANIKNVSRLRGFPGLISSVIAEGDASDNEKMFELVSKTRGGAKYHYMFKALIFHRFDLIKHCTSVGLDINIKYKNNTLLLAMVEYGEYKSVKFLLENGISINEINDDGDNPLHIAAKKGYLEIFKLLLESGVNPNIFNKNQLTPIDVASENNHQSIIDYYLIWQSQDKYRPQFISNTPSKSSSKLPLSPLKKNQVPFAASPSPIKSPMKFFAARDPRNKENIENHEDINQMQATKKSTVDRYEESKQSLNSGVASQVETKSVRRKLF